jgi:hypothetical protein
MYYILNGNVENDDKDAILEGIFTDIENEDYSFCTGRSLAKNHIETPIIFHISEYALRGTMTDHLSVDDINGPIFSLKTKEFFKTLAIASIEYYQLTLLDEFSESHEIENQKEKNKEEKHKKVIEYTNYFIANVVSLVDCVDHENSILEYFFPPESRNKTQETTIANHAANDPFANDNPNDIDFITKLVLDESKIDPALKVFRLFDQPNILIFHESLVELIQKEGLSGFVFIPVEKYTEAIPDEEESNEEEEEKQEDPVQQKKRKSFSFYLD